MYRITDSAELATYRRKTAPAIAQHLRCKLGDAEAWTWTENGRFYAIGFLGRAQNPHQGSRFYFRTAEQRAAWIRRLFETAAAVQASKTKRQAEKAEARAKGHALQVGDVLMSSWGYDQTNVDYYQVTALVGKQMVEYRPIAAQTEQAGYMSGYCVPAPGNFKGPAKRAKVCEYGQRDSIRIASYATASKLTPQTVAGVAVYAPARWTAYA